MALRHRVTTERSFVSRIPFELQRLPGRHSQPNEIMKKNSISSNERQIPFTSSCSVDSEKIQTGSLASRFQPKATFLGDVFEISYTLSSGRGGRAKCEAKIVSSAERQFFTFRSWELGNFPSSRCCRRKFLIKFRAADDDEQTFHNAEKFRFVCNPLNDLFSPLSALIIHNKLFKSFFEWKTFFRTISRPCRDTNFYSRKYFHCRPLTTKIIALPILIYLQIHFSHLNSNFSLNVSDHDTSHVQPTKVRFLSGSSVIEISARQIGYK